MSLQRSAVPEPISNLVDIENMAAELVKPAGAETVRAFGAIFPAVSELLDSCREAVAALDAFAKSYAQKYDKAIKCLTKDRDALLAFYDFPAEHWKYLGNTCGARMRWTSIFIR